MSSDPWAQFLATGTRVDSVVNDEAISVSAATLRDALQRAHDGESPDALVEEVRTVDCE